ncbi:hypothetical protein JR316_0004161 [Psilocybe cubensis]|uniref:Uncharacterized protein n=2 Tax=Psilocybe cubensis TaxID=181762 RepID=A0ACB8H3I7_PSICU|nr:hypothetical protein JR316_0004161 [Psilocybe cubensis]KAH9482066.1 hypothetical protein JR316_0004161 [Psilocybe cubensis]
MWSSLIFTLITISTLLVQCAALPVSEDLISRLTDPASTKHTDGLALHAAEPNPVLKPQFAYPSQSSGVSTPVYSQNTHRSDESYRSHVGQGIIGGSVGGIRQLNFLTQTFIIMWYLSLMALLAISTLLSHCAALPVSKERLDDSPSTLTSNIVPPNLSPHQIINPPIHYKRQGVRISVGTPVIVAGTIYQGSPGQGIVGTK